MPTAVTIPVRTINDSEADQDRLCDLWARVNSDNLHVTFDFTDCRFLRQNAVAFLGGLARLIEYRGGHCTFNWNTLQGPILGNLQQNGFVNAMNGNGGGWTGNSIPYREDTHADRDNLLDYLKTKWMGRPEWVNVSDRLRDLIVGRVCEAFENAFEHAQSQVGVFTCGQHFPNKKLLCLTVVDFGIGIPANVRAFVQRSTIPAHAAMQWAFKPETTTKPNGVGRGIGLDLLKRFVQMNNGRMEVYSHDGNAVIAGAPNGPPVESYQTRSRWFEGTLINIRLICDDSYYCLESERPEQPLF